MRNYQDDTPLLSGFRAATKRGAEQTEKLDAGHAPPLAWCNVEAVRDKRFRENRAI